MNLCSRTTSKLTQGFRFISPKCNNIRSFHSSRPLLRRIEQYDVFESQQAEVSIQGYNESGFQIEGCDVFYSLFILPKLSFLWNVPAMEYLKPEHFSILEVTEPIG